MTSQDSSAALAGRYGAPAPWRRRLLIAASVLLALVFLTWLTWTAVAHSRPAVDSDLVSFSITDEHSASVLVDVRVTDEATDVECLLRAFAEDHSVVGELAFTPVEGTNDVVIRTERRATTVEKLGCTAPGQPRPR